VRAGMVAHPLEYRWSSFAANATGQFNVLLTPHSEYLALGLDARSRHAAYLDLFRSEQDSCELDQIRQHTNAGFALGSARFVGEIEAMTGRRGQIGRTGRPGKNAPSV